MMQTMRIGVLGAGMMGRAHAEIVKTRVASARLAAISDPDASRAEMVAGASGAKIFSDALELIQSDEVDAVVIASPDERHHEQVAACLATRKPVLCEKPLAPMSASCRALVQQEQALGRRLIQVGYMRRFDPAYTDLKAALESGAVGEAAIVKCAHRNASAPSFFRGTMAVTNAMVHEFDICRWLLDAEISRIRIDAVGGREAARGDPLLATLEMSTGQLASIEVFMNARYGYDVRTEIIGRNGVLLMGAPATTYRLSNSEPGVRYWPDFTYRFKDAYVLQMQAWIGSIQGGGAVGAGASDGLRASLAAEAGERSLSSGQWEAVDG
jgi:myo-inositol 2-dehydrogenase/D-chiro-inositol 1-dehydrogenase